MNATHRTTTGTPGGPPADVPANELWEQITALPRPSRVVEFPRKDPTGKPICEIAIWVLTQAESMACQREAGKFARATMRDDAPKPGEIAPDFEDLYRNEAAVQVLYRACRRPKDLRFPFFPSPLQMRTELQADEIGVLMAHYNAVRTETGPILSELTLEELDAWTARLEEGGNAYFLDFFSSEAKNALIMHLASRRRSSSTGTTSPGAPPEEPPSAPPNLDPLSGS